MRTGLPGSRNNTASAFVYAVAAYKPSVEMERYMIEIQSEIQSCDVLIAGGGIAGLMAAIAAADQGSDVIVAEKGDTRRSGSGATGNDHFLCYIPEVHNCPLEEILREMNDSMIGGNADPHIQRQFLKRSFEVVQDWHRWGIDMRPHGEWEFNGHAFPGRKRIFLKYNGANQKAVLTKEAQRRGVRIINKTPVTEFLKDKRGGISGAIGIDISKKEPQVVLFRTGSIISATGNTSRLYPSITPSQLFNTAHCPANAGGGRGAAYRAGARLINLEIPNTHAGPKFFERCGKATWIGVLSDRTGKAAGPFVAKPTKELGDITADIWLSVFTDKMYDGTGPVYMNCTETSKDDMAYMMWGLQCEGDTALIDAMKAQKINLSKDMVEFTKYEPILIGRGIEIDEFGRTNIPGLYAAGDETGNFRADIAGAAVMGRFAGEHCAAYSKNGKRDDMPVHCNHTVRERLNFYSSLLEQNRPAHWEELNHGIQQILHDYAGIHYGRSESLLKTGYEYLEQLEKNAVKSLRARDSHELMRALECFDLLLIGKLICLTALERKETRGMHKRMDYTFTNPLLNRKMLTIQQKDGQPALQWRDWDESC
jgi:succinate dehydrogenase/fumarate reductase flavoprotein subunit